MSKIERHEEVAMLTEAIKASPTLFVTDFSGLNVLKMTEFRGAFGRRVDSTSW